MVVLIQLTFFSLYFIIIINMPTYFIYFILYFILSLICWLQFLKDMIYLMLILIFSAYMEQMEQQMKKSKIIPDIDSWIEFKISNIKEYYLSSSNNFQPVLPPVLANVPNLPSSLIPATASDFYNGQKNAPEWG